VAYLGLAGEVMRHERERRQAAERKQSAASPSHRPSSETAA
jgi:hypothetical protein